MGYYVVKYISKTLTIHEDTTTDVQVSKAGDLEVRVE